jgi:hypothetical protein
MAVLVVLVVARAVSTVCREGSPYVLYGDWVKLFELFGPQKLCENLQASLYRVSHGIGHSNSLDGPSRA